MGSGTGESGGTAVFHGLDGAFWRNTKVQDGRCEGYDLVQERSGDLERPPQERRSSKTVSTVTSKKPQDRYAMARLLEETKRDVCRLIGAAEKQDIIEKGVAGVAFWDDLSELWRLRGVREEEWASAVNFLQSALANGHFEAFSVSQCKTLQLIVWNYIAAGLMRQDDVRRVKLMLRGAGLDPWKAISSCEGAEE